jgi:signal transduction histidine kinase
MRQLLEQLKPHREQSSSHAATDLRRCILELAKSWQHESTRLQVDVPADAVVVTGPESRLRMVVEHVLHNAMDAAGENGEVMLRLRSDNSEATIAIEDNGPGMTPEFVREKLFRPFDSTKVTGYGMGAYQIREYVRQLGGRLEVQSDAGRGTLVRAILPLAGSRTSESPSTHTAATR